MFDDKCSRDAEDLAGEIENDKPERQLSRPGRDAERDDGGHEQELVRQGIKDDSQLAPLVEAPCHPAVDAVTQRSGGKHCHGPIAKGLIGMPRFHTVRIVHRKPHEHGDEENTGQGDLIGDSHRGSLP